jgi:uncharacterized LabA/DUF88 family protein
MERHRGQKINYPKLLRYLDKEFGTVILKIGYGAAKEGESLKFQEMLKGLGVQLKYKEPKKLYKKGKTIFKADHDVKIAVDMVTKVDLLDRIILCSADGDMAPAVEYVMDKGLDVVVMASGISHELKDIATASIEITEEFIDKRGYYVNARKDRISDTK